LETGHGIFLTFCTPANSITQLIEEEIGIGGGGQVLLET
jgi:hypothetical protein